MRFIDLAWEANVQATGNWHEPDPWSGNDVHGWAPRELSTALDALKRIYPPEKSGRIFKTQPRVSELLLDADYKAQGGLLSVGMDAALVDISKYPELMDRLRYDDHFDGARFELALMAAMRRQGIIWEYEPLKPPPGEKQPNPDFSIAVDETFVADAKAAKVSNAVRELRAWKRGLFFGTETSAPQPLSADLRFHDGLAQRFPTLSQTERQELAVRIRAVMHKLNTSGVFPASETVDGMVTITVDGRGMMSSTGDDIDLDVEAERIVRGLVSAGAAQIPPDRNGCVFVRYTAAFAHGLFGPAIREIGRWMREEGSADVQLQHVLLIGFAFHQHRPLLHVVPVSRKATPAPIIKFANALARGLNHHACRSNGWGSDAIPEFDESAQIPGAEEPDFEQNLPSRKVSRT